MTIADEMQFKVKEGHYGIVATDLTVINDIDKNGVKDGDDVILKYLEKRVLIEDISLHTDGCFSGMIKGFEPSCGIKFKGLQIGKVISFQRKHIFCCVRS